MIVLHFFLGFFYMCPIDHVRPFGGAGFWGLKWSSQPLHMVYVGAHVGSFGEGLKREKTTPTKNFSVGVHFGGTWRAMSGQCWAVLGVCWAHVGSFGGLCGVPWRFCGGGRDHDRINKDLIMMQWSAEGLWHFMLALSFLLASILVPFFWLPLWEHHALVE